MKMPNVDIIGALEEKKENKAETTCKAGKHLRISQILIKEIFKKCYVSKPE
jgi:hypothetical protein